MPKGSPDDDDEPELPPLDADDDVERERHDDDHELDTDDAREGHGLDDENATDVDIGDDGVGADDDDDPSDPHADAELVDVGDLDDGLVGDLDGRPGSPSGDDDGVAGEDLSLGIDDDDGASDLADGGAEGTDEAPEDAVDVSRFPDLDADDEGDLDDEELLDALGPAADEHELPPWADVRWEAPVGAGASIPCSTVSVLGGRVAAGGSVLLTVDEGAHAARQVGVRRDVRAIAVLSGGAIAAANNQEIALVDVGQPEQVTRLFEPAPPTVTLAFATSRLWAHCDRALWAIPTPPSPPVSVRRDGVRAIASAGRALVVLTATGDEVSLERVGGDDEIAARAPLEGEPARIAASADVALCATAGGDAIAIWSAGDLVMRRGGDFAYVHLPPVVAATFAGDDVRAALLAIVQHRQDAILIHVPHDGVATQLAVLGAIDSIAGEAGVAVAWDASRELLWVACDKGLLAYGPAQDH